MISETPIELDTFDSPEGSSLPESESHEESPTSAILDNLAIPISVELARTRLSLKELGTLRNGQTIELNKKPGDLVDLIVSGKRIGQGELVEVEGELGVRIASLVK